ncbi:hypothetical protein Efla_003806 [Eimeria flavescens]
MPSLTLGLPLGTAAVNVTKAPWRLQRLILSFFLWFTPFFLLERRFQQLLKLPDTYAAAADTARGFPTVRLPTASEALTHTLKLLYSSPGNRRELGATPRASEDSDRGSSPLPVCHQSKYLCQIHNLHNPIPKHPRPLRHKAITSYHAAALGLPQHSFADSGQGIHRSRRLADILFGGEKTLKKQRGSKQLAPPLATDHPPSAQPDFVRVLQLSKQGGVFLPLRIQLVLSDFTHPSEGLVSGPSASLWKGLESVVQDDKSPGTRSDLPESRNKNPATSPSSPTDEDAQTANSARDALQFLQVRRFFEVDVVPSALSWLQRIVMVNRRSGPLVLKTEDDHQKGENRLGTDRCGLCPLPSLLRIRRKDGSRESLVMLEGADVLLLYRTAKNPADKRSHVCQVDDEYRPIVVCMSIPHGEAEMLYEKRNTSFPDVVGRLATDIVNSFAVNAQTLPYFLTWDPTWRKQALRRLQTAAATGFPPPILALTRITIENDAASSSRKQKDPGQTATSRQGRQQHFLLTSPAVTRAVRRLYQCPSALGLPLSLDSSDGSESATLLASLTRQRRPPEGNPLADIMLAAIEDTGWYLTETLWSRETLLNHTKVQNNVGCALLARVLTSLKKLEKNAGQRGNPSDLSSNAKAKPASREKRLERLNATTKDAHHEPDYAECPNSTMNLLHPPTRPTRTSCSRIVCVSDDDKMEGPMLLPTSKTVNWVAAHIISKLPNGSEKSTVCMRGENGQKKALPYLGGAVLECPNIDEVCFNRPCKNGGIPKYGVCICKPGTFGRNCEYWDTERNRRRFPNRFSYGTYAAITVLKGEFFAIPALIDGPQQLRFKTISKLPSGVAVDPETGAIYGTAAETTKGCIPLAIEAQMHEPPHAAERTLVRLRVADNLLRNNTKPHLTLDAFPVDEENENGSLSLDGSRLQQPRQSTASANRQLQHPMDCEHYVLGDKR